jgi:hypothetical protein
VRSHHLMRSLLRILPFLPALGPLAALSTGTDNFLGPLAYWLSAVAACSVLLFFTLWAAKRRPGTLSFRHPSRYVLLVVGTLALSIGPPLAGSPELSLWPEPGAPDRRPCLIGAGFAPSGSQEDFHLLFRAQARRTMQRTSLRSPLMPDVRRAGHDQR